MAAASGVDPATVVTALVTPLSKRIEAAVAKGKFTAEKATTMEAALVQRVTDFVNAKKTMPAPATVTPTT